MKILLLNPPAKKLHARDYFCSASTKADYYLQPLDLLVLSGILGKKHEVNVLDANVLRYSFEKAKKEIQKIKPNAIFFVTSTPTLENDMKFLKVIKNLLPDCRFYGSGNYLYFKPKDSMKRYNFLDGILLDFTTNHILKLLDGKKKGLKNLIYRDKGKVIITKLDKEKKFSYPIPKHELFPIKKYHLPLAKRHPLTVLLTNFGCPFRCSFCFAENMPYKERELDNVIDEMKYIQKLGIKEIHIRDYTFTVNKEFVKKICRRMIDEKINLTWVCLSRADLVDKDLLLLMKKAGCHTIQFGVESGNDKILEKYRKSVDKKKIKEAFSYCSKIGINTLAHFILGLPGENKKTVIETINFAKEIDCDYASFNLFTPLFGTKAREEVIKRGWLKKKDLYLLDSSDDELSVETPWLSMRELKRLHKKALREFYMRPRYLFKMLRKAKSINQLFELVRNGYAIIKNAF